MLAVCISRLDIDFLCKTCSNNYAFAVRMINKGESVNGDRKR